MKRFFGVLVLGVLVVVATLSLTGCGGGSSQPAPPPPPPPAGAHPTISHLSPPLAVTGSQHPVSLTITGTGFDSNTVVNGFSSPLTAASFTASKLVVTVPQSDLVAVTPIPVTVSNNNGQSAPMNFYVTTQGFVSVTFDDGYQSTYDHGFPILDAAGMSYTWNIITNRPDSGDNSYASWPEILNVASRPNAEIGNHTRTHGSTTPNGDGFPQPDGSIKFLTLLDQTDLTAEISGAQQDFLAHGLKPTSLAYPYGDYDMTPDGNLTTLPFSQQMVERAVQAANLMGARTTDFCSNVPGMPAGQPPACGYAATGANPFALQSFEVNQNNIPTTLDEIKYWTSPALPGAPDLSRQWTIITFHQVDEANVDSVDHSLLQNMVGYFAANNVYLVTTSEGLAILNLNGQTFTGDAAMAVRPDRKHTSRQ